MNINFSCTLYIAIWAEDESFGTTSKCTKMLGVGYLEAHCMCKHSVYLDTCDTEMVVHCF